jgi:hypothetical protein
MEFFEILQFSTKAPPEIFHFLALFGRFLVEGNPGCLRGVEKSLFLSFLADRNLDRSDRKL